MPVDIEDKKSISMAELKQELDSIKKRDQELGLRSARTAEYLKIFVELSPKKAAELKKKLEKLNIARLKQEHINKITDLLPLTKEDVKVILQGFDVSISSSDMEKIVEVVKGFKK
jgi:DNA-directed RNA polymerase subunit F